MKKANILILTAAVLLLAACSSNKCYIDNPTDTEMSVSIDGKEAIKIAPLEHKELEGGKPGEHTLTVNGGEELKVTIEEGVGFINPAQATYVICKEVYGSVVSDLPSNTITIGEYDFSGPFELSQKLYINTDSIDLSVTQEFPESVKAAKGQPSKALTKIFREADFIAYFKAEYE